LVVFNDIEIEEEEIAREYDEGALSLVVMGDRQWTGQRQKRLGLPLPPILETTGGKEIAGVKYIDGKTLDRAFTCF
jgi:hypothetical protein